MKAGIGIVQIPILVLMILSSAIGGSLADDEGAGDDEVVSLEGVRMFVDELPDMPRIRGYRMKEGVPVSRTLQIGMYQKKWRFHKDLPLTRVFAYGTSRRTATVPGPTIESLQGVPTHVAWQNHLPRSHILPSDATLPMAAPPPTRHGVPTVVHLHGAIAHPASDGNSNAWFTAGFRSTGPTWSHKTYTYPNVQEPGNLWYHDHAMGLTRVNLLSGLVGAYVIRNPELEKPLNLPSGPAFDRNLVVFDRSFRKDGSIYMNSTGNNPEIHPQWQPEYFGDAIIVNGKAWPVMRVQRRKYRFRILNASNARFFQFFFANDSRLSFTHVGADSVYLSSPVKTKKFLLAPSEIADVVVDFTETSEDEVILANDAAYPYPSGDPTDARNGMVMKFLVGENKMDVTDMSTVPISLMNYPKPMEKEATKKRYIAMFEYESSSGEPTHLYLNGKSYEERATETPAVGTTEVWDVINLTDDNHPLHIHLGLFQVLEQRSLDDVDDVKKCMMKIDDPVKCDVEGAARKGARELPEPQESGWKNVYKMKPGYVTRILVRFALLRPVTNSTFEYPFDATAEPGYVYHCHILDHEDNEMMRPMKLTR